MPGLQNRSRIWRGRWRDGGQPLLALSFRLKPVTRRVKRDTHEPAVNGQSPLANIREPFVKARRHYQISFWSTLAIVVTVLALLPAALASMVWELRGQGDTIVYDLFTATGIGASGVCGLKGPCNR